MWRGPQVTGILENDDYMDSVAQAEGVLYAKSIVKAGGAVVSVADGLPTWVAEVMVERSPVEEAIKWIQEIEQEALDRMVIRPKPSVAQQ